MDSGMTETTIVMRKMTASEGYVLTNGDVYGKEVYLGVNDSAENWHEITDAEYAEILAERERLADEDYVLAENADMKSALNLLGVE